MCGNYIYVFTSFVLAIIGQVESKHCTVLQSSGTAKHFFCSAYEYCCGSMCCRTRGITFYQLWYFWLMVILMLLLCSGGGWWYRFRYRGQFNGQSHVAFPSTNVLPQRRGYIYGARPYFQTQPVVQGSPPPYASAPFTSTPYAPQPPGPQPYPPTGGVSGPLPYPSAVGAPGQLPYPSAVGAPGQLPYPPANAAPGSQPYPPVGMPQTAAPMGPPPPYTGPPPNYSTVTGNQVH